MTQFQPPAHFTAPPQVQQFSTGGDPDEMTFKQKGFLRSLYEDGQQNGLGAYMPEALANGVGDDVLAQMSKRDAMQVIDDMRMAGCCPEWGRQPSSPAQIGLFQALAAQMRDEAWKQIDPSKYRKGVISFWIDKMKEALGQPTQRQQQQNQNQPFE